MTRFLNYTISPSPLHAKGFQFNRDDNDGERATGWCGYGPTVDDCIRQIEEMECDRDPEEFLVAHIGRLRDETLQLAMIFRDAARALGVE
jgi:hypothetical protein